MKILGDWNNISGSQVTNQTTFFTPINPSTNSFLPCSRKNPCDYKILKKHISNIDCLSETTYPSPLHIAVFDCPLTTSTRSSERPSVETIRYATVSPTNFGTPSCFFSSGRLANQQHNVFINISSLVCVCAYIVLNPLVFVSSDGQSR